MKTRPDTRQSSRGRLGRGSNVKTTIEKCYGWTDGPTQQHVELRVRDFECSQIAVKLKKLLNFR